MYVILYGRVYAEYTYIEFEILHKMLVTAMIASTIPNYDI